MADGLPQYPQMIESLLDLTPEQVTRFVDKLEAEEAGALLCRCTARASAQPGAMLP